MLHYSSADGANLDRHHNDRNGDSGLANDDLNDAEGNAYAGDLAAGRWQYIRFTKVNDNTTPEITNIELNNTPAACDGLAANAFAATTSCEGEVCA